MAIVERPTAWLAERRSGAVPSTTALPSLGVVLALARTDGPRMLRHPSYLLILPLGLLLIGVRSLDQVSLDMVGPLIFMLVVGLFVGTLITANLAAVRAVCAAVMPMSMNGCPISPRRIMPGITSFRSKWPTRF